MHILLLALTLMQGAPGETSEYARYNRVTKFNRYFSKYSKRYFGVGFDWQYFKAQAVAESNLRSDARSVTGATGLMQIMPRTFEEIQRRNPVMAGPIENPRWNIAAGIWYDRQNFALWTAERPFLDRLKFMFGSYNAGRANILRAQEVAVRLELDGNRWVSIERGLPRVTGRRAGETVAYVSRIFEIKTVLR